jgi:hypothetical protein
MKGTSVSFAKNSFMGLMVNLMAMTVTLPTAVSALLQPQSTSQQTLAVIFWADITEGDRPSTKSGETGQMVKSLFTKMWDGCHVIQL